MHRALRKLERDLGIEPSCLWGTTGCPSTVPRLGYSCGDFVRETDDQGHEKKGKKTPFVNLRGRIR
jgi:hypothetical protein